MIHPTAIIEKGAKIGKNVEIEPYVVIKKNVVIEDGVQIKAHVYIDGYTHIGEDTVIYPSAVIGTKTQARKFQGEKTSVRIGKRCEIREFVQINSSFGEDSVVSVGNDCLIMACCHVAHHCTLGNNVILSNNVALAGHVEIEDHAIIGGATPIHQNVRIGRHAMVGGLTRIGNDVPPFTIGGDIPFRLAGLNLVGLKRHGFSLELRKALSQAFRLIFRSNLSLTVALDRIENELSPYEEVKHFVKFCRDSERGIIGLAKQPDNKDERLELDESQQERVLKNQS
ncbi:acyl-ACP--UDP-N-acetylglucosamine O-acyltransferase [Chlamydiales bacterium]|nr:acyl-ACP--UDP-N-acetylglucosamine O-acyltransferase [Chlamydiales bacterium]